MRPDVWLLRLHESIGGESDSGKGGGICTTLRLRAGHMGFGHSQSRSPYLADQAIIAKSDSPPQQLIDVQSSIPQDHLPNFLNHLANRSLDLAPLVVILTNHSHSVRLLAQADELSRRLFAARTLAASGIQLALEA